MDAERVQLVLAGHSANTHWCVDGVVVKSDWCGAQSFLVEHTSPVLAPLRGDAASSSTA